jgi:hypothetical protein
MKVFACVNHAPDEVAKFLCTSCGYTANDIHVVSDSVNKRRRVQLIMDYKQWQRLYKVLPKNDHMIVVVFGTPFQFYSWNLIPLDYRESDEPHLEAFQYIPLDRKVLQTPAEPVRYQHRNYLNFIVETVAAFDSLLHGLMSFIYTMKSTEQKIAKECACRFLYNGTSMENLRRDLSALNERQIEKMINLLSSEVAQRIQQAFSDKISIEERSRKYNVSAYELRYIEHNAVRQT